MSKSEYSPIIDAIKFGDLMDFIAIYEVRYGSIEKYGIRDILSPKSPKYFFNIGIYGIKVSNSISDSVKWALSPDYVQDIRKMHRCNNSIPSHGWNSTFHMLKLWDRLFDESLSKNQIGDTAIIAILSPHRIFAITNKNCQPTLSYTTDIEAIKKACDENYLTLDVADIDISNKDTIAESANRLEHVLFGID